MFGLSWEQIILILLAALFLLGPERIPTAVRWAMDSLRKLRTMAAGAQEELRSQVGPELDELRRQVAELQSLKELNELRQLRELNPRAIIGKNILGDEFSGGVTGFLGLNGTPDAPPADGAGTTNGTTNGTPNGTAAAGSDTGTGGTAGPAGGTSPGTGSAAAGGAATMVADSAAGTVADTAAGTGRPSAAADPAPSAAPTRRVPRALSDGETPPFDDEGT